MHGVGAHISFSPPILTKSPFRVFAHGAKVTVVARDADGLGLVRARLGIATISADVTVETAAQRILREVHPDILVLNAGAKPRMGRLDQLSWADFSVTWETDVKAGLYWLQAALKTPLKSGSRSHTEGRRWRHRRAGSGDGRIGKSAAGRCNRMS